MHGVTLATWDFCCNSFRICFIVSGSLFRSMPVQCYLVLLYPLTEEVFKKYGFIRNVIHILRQHV